MMCHIIGFPPLSTIGFGVRYDASLMRVPIAAGEDHGLHVFGIHLDSGPTVKRS